MKNLTKFLGLNLAQALMGQWAPPVLEARMVRQKMQVIGHDEVEHFFVGRPARTKEGEIIHFEGRHTPDPCKCAGPARKHIRKSRELITAWNVKVKLVKVRNSQPIDRNKYTGAVLRDLRAERGVGNATQHLPGPPPEYFAARQAIRDREAAKLKARQEAAHG